FFASDAVFRGLRVQTLRGSILNPRTATVQLQQSIWSLSDMPGIRQHHRSRFESRDPEPGTQPRSRCDRTVDEAAVRLGAKRTPEILKASGHSNHDSLSSIDSRTTKNHCAGSQWI